jgi:hypothetical protein
MNISKQTIGTILAVVGSIFSLVGAAANNMLLDPLLARQLWLVSNPLLLCWAIGIWKKYWCDGIGVDAICAMYTFYTATGILSFII